MSSLVAIQTRFRLWMTLRQCATRLLHRSTRVTCLRSRQRVRTQHPSVGPLHSWLLSACCWNLYRKATMGTRYAHDWRVFCLVVERCLLSRVGCLSGRYESAFVDAVVGEARVQFLEQEHVQGECVLSGHVVVCFDSVLVAERPSGRDVCGKAASQREFVERSWRLGGLLRGNRPRYSCHARSDCHYLRQTISHVGTPCHPW
jgi:hypothetical protein